MRVYGLAAFKKAKHLHQGMIQTALWYSLNISLPLRWAEAGGSLVTSSILTKERGKHAVIELKHPSASVIEEHWKEDILQSLLKWLHVSQQPLVSRSC